MSIYGFPRLFSVVVLLVLVQQGTCRQCYACKSDRNGPCGKPTLTNGATFKECDKPDELCYQYDFNVDGLEGYPPQYVQRGCFVKNKNPCHSQPGHHVNWKCDECADRDLCNDKPTVLTDPNTGGGNNNNNNNNNDGDGSSSLHVPCFVIISSALITLFKYI